VEKARGKFESRQTSGNPGPGVCIDPSDVRARQRLAIPAGVSWRAVEVRHHPEYELPNRTQLTSGCGRALGPQSAHRAAGSSGARSSVICSAKGVDSHRRGLPAARPALLFSREGWLRKFREGSMCGTAQASATSSRANRRGIRRPRRPWPGAEEKFGPFRAHGRLPANQMRRPWV